MLMTLKKQLAFLSAGILVISCGSKNSKAKSSAGPPVATTEEVTGPTTEDAAPVKPMQLTFVSPKSENILLIKNYVEIEVAITDPQPSTNWNLYYSKDKGAITSALPIAEDLSVDLTKIIWDTTFIESGSYYIFATLRTNGSDIVFLNEQAFEVSGSFVSNKPPVAQISYPAGDVVFAPGATIAISYIVSDPEKDAVAAKLEYSSDGSIWTLIADNIDTTKNSLDWTIDAAAPRSARYRLRITANDGHTTTSGYNDTVFGVTATPVTFDGAVKTALAANCVSCHSGALPMGNFVADVFTSANPAGASERKLSILSRTRTGAASPMPPSGVLTNEVRDLIQLWIWNNGLQN
jgi:hypothetical protein